MSGKNFNRLNKSFRILRNLVRCPQLKNRNICLIADNCNGCLISHDLNLPFRSPFVNLWLKPKDFIKYLSDMDHYIQCELSFVKEDGINYPIGKLDDIRIYFMHYKTEEQARMKWVERTKRIDREHLFLMMTEKNGCTMEDMEAFDALPFKNKVLFTHKPYPQIQCAQYIPGFEDEDECGILSDYVRGQLLGKRYYDYFDYVGWFNKGKCI
jgi:uncharacterized protein (DUF1919 family)